MKSWNELSMAERADVMKLAIEGGVYDLDAIRSGYNEYARGGKKSQSNWTMEDEAKYREWRSSLPDNLRNTDDAIYDMRGAYKAGMKPTLESDGKYHLQSRDPKTGRILKSPLHPTYLQAIATDASMGYYPTVDNQGNTYTQTWEGNQYKKGGSIHIKPSKRGTFTAAASKHGMGVQQFASKVLAHPENYSPSMRKKANFARNAAKWKHEDGGNLYGGYNPEGQQMKLGLNVKGWPNYTTEQILANAERIEQQKRVMEEAVARRANNYLTTSNDATSVAVGRARNQHLAERAVEGAKAHRAWEEEHPVATQWGNVLGTVPFAVAAYPLAATAGSGVVALGDAAAATSAGQAITAGLASLATAASTSVAGATAPQLLDLGLTSGFGAHGIQTAIDEGGVSPMTALELLPVTRVAKPAVEMGYSAAKPAIDRTVTALQNNYPALFDPYTSWDATLGYHGDNIFSRAIGTVGRRFGYTPKAEVPEFHRRLDINRPSQLKLDEEGNMIISSGRTGEGHDGIVNFATSEPARGHSSHKSLSGIDDYIIDSKAIGNQDFKSIQPSDTFFETGQLAIDPKSMTLVSGNTEMLDYAKSLGMRTLSSPRLRQLTASRMTKEDVINSRSEGIAKFLQNVGDIKYGKGQQNAGQIGEEMQRLTSMRGTPTMQDYSYFEGLTGLNSGVRPAEMWNGTKEQGLELFGNWGKPRRTPTFNHVAYAPASNIEAIYREAKIGKRPWTDYYEALEKMPSAREQLGLNSAMDTYLGEPQVPENFLTVKPQVRTKIGDVEIDNPNLLYHLDRGDGAGAFSTQGAYIEDGFLFPGTPKDASDISYSWWNKGKPYATTVKGQPMTRLMTTTEDVPGMLHVRSQNYPIGQWNGRKGFVTNTEYVDPERVNVSGSTYTLDPNYGWRKVTKGSPTLSWEDADSIANSELDWSAKSWFEDVAKRPFDDGTPYAYYR